MNVDFQAELTARIRHGLAADTDVVMALATDDDTLATFAIAGGELRFDPPAAADVTFTFDSAETALAILTGEADPIAAFMAGRFRSDGNLPLAFVLLGLFRSDYGVEAPP